MKASNPLAALSVVVIGRNEGERLVGCLTSVARALGRYAPEVIYVDSASSDDSRAVAAQHGARVVELTRGAMSAARARNAGWQAAAGAWILFLDGDTQLVPGFVERALASATADDTAVVWGHRRESRPQTSWFNRVLDLDWVYRAGETDFCGGDALVRRHVLAAVGGFDASLIAGEEPELCARMRAGGWRILHIDTPMTGHDLAMTEWRQYWRRAKRAGYAYAQVADRRRIAGQAFWDGECRANLRRAGFWLVLPFAGALLAQVSDSAVPYLLTPIVLLLLTLRSAWRARWRGADSATLIVYGLHSHMQQFPIAAGQLAYARDRRRGARRGLIEYKAAA